MADRYVIDTQLTFWHGETEQAGLNSRVFVKASKMPGVSVMLSEATSLELRQALARITEAPKELQQGHNGEFPEKDQHDALIVASAPGPQAVAHTIFLPASLAREGETIQGIATIEGTQILRNLLAPKKH